MRTWFPRRPLLLAVALSGCVPTEEEDSGAVWVEDPAINASLDLPRFLYPYSPALPEALEDAADVTDNTPDDNPLTDEGATLGRVLFWDRSLSSDGTVACASCHLADAGFADDLPGSLGVAGTTPRKSMPLVNVGHYAPGRMFWDERADTLEAQVLLPFQDPLEMGLTLSSLVATIEAAPYYAPLFVTAFGDEAVTEDRIAQALAQFVRSITTFDAPWDAGVAAVGDPVAPFPTFSDEENRGKDIFFGRHEADAGPLCAGCHLPRLPGPGAGLPNPGIFQLPGPRVNGLPDPVDAGVGAVTGLPQDNGRFKSPSLRNVALRAPYMHDGRFETLEEVVAFYNDGIANRPNLDPILRDADGPRRLGLSAEDQAALVAFLGTLTDLGPSQDPRFADPFRHDTDADTGL